MATIVYTRYDLTRLLAMAKKLRIQDDIDHWTAELAKLDAEEAADG